MILFSLHAATRPLKKVRWLLLSSRNDKNIIIIIIEPFNFNESSSYDWPVLLSQKLSLFFVTH